MQRYFTRFGDITVLVCRLLPVVRTFIALPAGIARMPRLRFHLYTFVGSWPWCFSLAYVGLKLGQSWDSDPRLHAVMHQLDGVVLVALLVGAGWFVWHRWAPTMSPKPRPVSHILILLACFVVRSVGAAEALRPPCGSPQMPDYPVAIGAPVVRSETVIGWASPTCRHSGPELALRPIHTPERASVVSAAVIEQRRARGRSRRIPVHPEATRDAIIAAVP